jgi:negative regulator of flagellin synthesis FlgM
MKVNQPGSNPVSNSEASSVRHGGKASSPQEAKRTEHSAKGDVEKTSRNGANAEISKKSKEFAQAKSVASNTPDIREDKVADLKRRISEGSYKVDHAAVADRMVDDHLRLSGPG